jgi:hypothetical protein
MNGKFASGEARGKLVRRTNQVGLRRYKSEVSSTAVSALESDVSEVKRRQ